MDIIRKFYDMDLKKVMQIWYIVTVRCMTLFLSPTGTGALAMFPG